MGAPGYRLNDSFRNLLPQNMAQAPLLLCG